MKKAIYRRDRISVQLPDGYRLQISNRAKKEKASFSEIVRRAVKRFLGR